MNSPAVAIIILNYNGRNYLEKFLPSVMASTYSNKRIIVADNASSDDSLTWLRINYPLIEIIELDKNYGFAGGYNEALQQVQSDYYVLLNSDIEVSPGWIEDVIILMETDVNIAACQPKILSFYNKNYFEYAGAAGGWIDKLGYPFARGRIFDLCEEDKAQYNNSEKVFWASGAALFIKAACFHEVNGFDNHLFAHMEEIDLCWRLQRKGYSVYCCPSSVVYHVGGGTLPKTNNRKTFLNFRNNLIMLIKNLPAAEAIWKIPLRFLLDWVFALKCLLQKDKPSFNAIFMAHVDVYKWLRANFTYQQLPAKKMVTIAGVYSGSLIWAYFIRKKKHFSEIIKRGNNYSS